MTFVDDDAQRGYCLDGIGVGGFIFRVGHQSRREGCKNVRDVLAIVLLSSLCKQLFDVQPILVGANLAGGRAPVSGGGGRGGYLEAGHRVMGKE